MATKIDNFIVDKVYMGAMMGHDGSQVRYTLSQISNPQLAISANSTDVTDAAGNTIMSILNAKSIELSGDSAVFDLSLLGAVNGADNVVGVTESVYFDIQSVGTSATTIELEKIPVSKDEITHIYMLSKTKSLAEEYTLGDTAGENTFAVAEDESTKKITITLPTATRTEEVEFYVSYAYNTSANASSVTAKLEDFPKTGRFVMQILGYDVCDKETQKSATLIMPSAQLNCDMSITFQSQISQNFTIKALSDYCAKENVGFKLIIGE